MEVALASLFLVVAFITGVTIGMRVERQREAACVCPEGVR